MDVNISLLKELDSICQVSSIDISLLTELMKHLSQHRTQLSLS
jgi:UDP-N-acetyl-D-mannosaminuronate dehydrogenase